jgi:hypothetical protein
MGWVVRYGMREYDSIVVALVSVSLGILLSLLGRHKINMEITVASWLVVCIVAVGLYRLLSS